EGDLLRLIEPHYNRADDEGRTIVQNMLEAPADLRVDGDELHIDLAPM
ncbi:MAG: hypothetical protein GY944_16105, partial [bacterium]|nr:hypothetical protein [bacterium]